MRSFPGKTGLALAAIILFGGFPRFHELGRTALWIDEITIVEMGGVNRTPAGITREIFASGFRGYSGQHMPFQYVWTNIFLRLYRAIGVQPSEALYRLPFVLLGIATIPLAFLAGRRMYGIGAGLWFSFLLALSFFHAYQARDVTSYVALMFFLTLGWCGLIPLLKDSSASMRSRIIDAGLLLAGTMGAMFTHLTAWFALAAQGLIAAGFLVVRWLRDKGPFSRRLAARRAELLVMAVLFAASVPFLQLVPAMIGTTTTAEPGPKPDLWPMFVYQFAIFGWGRGQGRLLAFCVCLAVGLFLALWNRDTRPMAVAQLAMGLIPAALFFYALRRDFFPRYLTVSFLPLMGFAALAFAVLAERIRRSGARRAGAVIAVLVLIAWHVPPYRELFAMRDKLMPMSQVRDWIEQNCPPGGLYVWRNGYHLREVPGLHPPPNRSWAFGVYPNSDVPLEVFAARANNVRSIFSRFPDAVYIREVEVDPRFGDWGMREFAVKDLMVNQSVNRLWKWGLGAHGCHTPESPRFLCCRNRPEDVRRLMDEARRPFVWPTGPGWRYIQTPDAQVFVTPAAEGAALAAHVPEGGGAEYDLQLRGAALDAGTLTAWLVKEGQWLTSHHLSFERAQPWQGALGPFALDASPSSFALSRYPLEQMNLVVYEMALRRRERGG
jgi:hypothetical protein